MPLQRAWIPVVAVAALAALLRAIGFELTFPDTGEVILAPDDAQYHARRAWYSFLHFPEVLLFDAYLNYPKGAAIPWPPLYDLLLAATARLFGSTARVFELTLAWAPVALGAGTAALVVVATRQVASAATAVGAGVLYAWLPASIAYSRIGNPDHHAAVSFLAAALLTASLAFVRAPSSMLRIGGAQTLLVVLRVAMLLSWHGSLLYLVLTELALVVAATLNGRREQLLALCVGQLASAAWIAPFAASSASDVAGSLSPIELSLLHPSLLVLFAWVCGASSELERRWPDAAWQKRALRTLVLGGVPLLLALALPATREGLAWAWGYAGRDEHWIAANFEAQPLFAGGVGRALSRFGYAAFVLPLLPVASLALARAEALRGCAVVLATWCAALCLLTFSNTRYGNDFAAPASIALALGLAMVARALHARVPKIPVGVAAVALGGLLLLPAGSAQLVRAASSFAHLRGERPADTENVAPNLMQSIDHFMRRVRAATPETAGYDDTAARPAYGILSPPTLGFAVKYGARRPTPADNFGPYLGPPGLALTSRFYSATDERKAVAVASRLRARYVITTLDGLPTPEMMVYRLQAFDGTGRRGQAPLEHFRLILDDPPIGVPLGKLSGVTKGPIRNPYKLFEIVKGATLAVAAVPGSEVAGEVEIETSTGRRFTYRRRAQADAEGVARIRVPYATSTRSPTKPTGPYRVSVGGQTLRVDVSDEQVAGGAVIEVP